MTSTAQFWDDLYGEREQVWSGNPNPVLAAVAAELAPGTALDLGCGEGADAVHLAAAGWTVTGIDISTTALARAVAHAADAGVADRIAFEHHDLATSFPTGPFDLVSAQFLQSPVELPRAAVLRAAGGAVAPGGSLLVVAHAAMPPGSRHEHHQSDEPLPTPESDRAALELPDDGWDVVRAEIVEREAEGPDGELRTLLDSVLLVRRHP